ncbi:hypothetical protein CC86DRAFT_299496 [Ophiobolus disseminans]|uniref:Uncharacterized protein n=1 Tax=Ophiobolus disseminans TaxID=1469910 RepID=A0A6A6ZQH3_9PLEO|nr:hypothetical protein CC86DRAFT_299496 [Ophiobolus disseminans]
MAAGTTQPYKQQRKTKSALKKDGPISKEPTANIASIFRMRNNNQATLSGIPAELRLQIYSHLCDSTLIHVHNHKDHNAGTSRFTWTPCRSPSAASPLLCANPKWSGMCEEEDRCTYKIYAPPEPVGFWALAASNKSIRNETQEFFLRRTVVSIHPHDLRPWLDHLEEKDPQRLDNLRRITLAAPNSYRNFNNTELQLVRDRIPNLEGLGLQCQDSLWRWVRSRLNNDIQMDDNAWKRWHLVDWLKAFDPSVTIAMEAMVWRKVHPRWNPNDTEQQVAIRVTREGRTAGDGSGYRSTSGWADEDVEVEVVKPGNLASKKRNAKWRQWWRGKEMKGFA